MTDLAKRFEESRARLRAVAYRVLGSSSEAEDAVQEAWLRLTRSEATVDNLGGWLTTVVARIALDMLRVRTRRENRAPTPPAEIAAATFESDMLLADALAPALLVVLETLTPAERVAFVLHDTFDVSFEDIASILGRTPAAARQLASRARRRVRGEEPHHPDDQRARALVDAFLAASRSGDVAALVALLAPDATMAADDAAVRMAAETGWAGEPLPSAARGADAVARALRGRANGIRRARIDGAPGAAWSIGGELRSLFVFTTEGDRIASIELFVDRARLAEHTVEIDDA